MRGSSRRSVLLAGAAAAGSAWISRPLVGFADAPSATNKVRYNAASTEGKKMLKIYAGAVGKMMALTENDPGDPASWIFQWYTHGVKQPWQSGRPSLAFKQPEISRIYPSASDPRQALATAMWDTCTHYNQPQKFFLPWHRMYVYSFEQIIRSISGESSFTLPYWNYTNTASRALPDEFRMPADPVFKYLYRDQRGVGVNEGQPIDGGGSNTWLNLQDMSFQTYLTDPGSVNGFCQNLDINLHGNVHVNVGAQPPNADLGMTYVPTAANDPIFWLHHCNIDRIWASWNKAGGANPGDDTFREQPYTFADSGGHPLQMKVGDVLDTQQRGYIYDEYLARPPDSKPFPPGGATSQLFAFSVHASSAQSVGPVVLTAQPTSLTLVTQSVPELPSSGVSNTFSIQLNSALDTRQVYLSLNDIRANQVPGVTYDVFLDLPPGTKPNRAELGYVGTINFFCAVGHTNHDNDPSSGENSVALLVTHTVRKMLEAGRLTATPTVTLVPNGSLVTEAQPRIGNIALVSQ